MTYCLIENNTITRYNVELPTVVGNTTISAGATDIAQYGLYELVGSAPDYNPITQTRTGPSYEIGNGVVTRIYTVLDKPAETLAQELAAVKAAKNMQINLWRAAANQSTFPYQGKLIACDQLSRSDIDGVAGSIALTGSFPVGWQGAWKATSNEYVMLPTVDSFKAFYAAMATQGAANFTRAQALKTALAAATTQAEVEAIAW